MKVRTCLLTLLIIFSTITAGAAELQIQSTASGVRYQEIVVGSGVAVSQDDVVTIHFIAWVEVNGSKGTTIFNSYDQHNPVTFKLGTNKVIQGWNDAIAGMKPGGKRLLFIPARLAYGKRSIEDVIPANADLIYEVELISVR